MDEISLERGKIVPSLIHPMYKYSYKVLRIGLIVSLEVRGDGGGGGGGGGGGYSTTQPCSLPPTHDISGTGALHSRTNSLAFSRCI
jgi:hypothetical protein